LATPSEDPSRHQERHGHISIRLQVRLLDAWEWLDALGWNDRGFNFYHPQVIQQPLLELKRGLIRFEGKVVWSAASTDDEVVLATLVNELIFKRAGSVVDDASLKARLLKLIRVPGMVEQKRRVLASLGLDIPDARLAQLLAKRKQERPLIQHGVEVQSERWSALVENALQMASVVESLDQWSKSLSKK
jgi:hypothetical protein